MNNVYKVNVFALVLAGSPGMASLAIGEVLDVYDELDLFEVDTAATEEIKNKEQLPTFVNLNFPVLSSETVFVAGLPKHNEEVDPWTDKTLEKLLEDPDESQKESVVHLLTRVRSLEEELRNLKNNYWLTPKSK